ncbi:hypothetical protein GTY86_23510, partial [Streptomyces sp. SID5770]|nr:hypothetical protein [Streptomyces sp. SID5770]
SLSGTWLGVVLSDRQRLLGQINASSGSPTDQIKHIYGAAWHTTALANGAFALAALMIASLVLTTTRQAALW